MGKPGVASDVGVGRRQDHVVLPDGQRRALPLEARKRVAQSWQTHHRAGLKSWSAAQEIDCHKPCRAPGTQCRTRHGQSQMCLPQRRAERPGRTRLGGHDVRVLEPVGFAAVGKRVRDDGPRQRHRHARLRFDLDLRLLGDLLLQHGDGWIGLRRRRRDRPSLARRGRAFERVDLGAHLDQLRPQFGDLARLILRASRRRATTDRSPDTGSDRRRNAGGFASAYFTGSMSGRAIRSKS